MIKAKNFTEEHLTEDVKEMLNNTESIIDTLQETSIACPEQYNALDEFGNIIGYFRLRHGVYTVDCPDWRMNGREEVYCACPSGDGDFDSSERCDNLKAGIEAVDEFYKKLKMIERVDNGNKIEFHIINDYTIEDVKEKLFEIEKTNFIPEKILELYRKGPSRTYHEMVQLMNFRYRFKVNRCKPLDEKEILDSIEHIKQFQYTITTLNIIFDKNEKDFYDLWRKLCRSSASYPHTCL